MLKVIVSNFDNTLINEDEAISTDCMLSIDSLRRKGYKFIITSSRTYNEILLYNKSYPFIDYIIAQNGSYVYDVIKNKTLFKKPLSNTIISKLLTLLKNKELIFSTEDSNFTDKNLLNKKLNIYKIRIKNYQKSSFTKLLEKTPLELNYYQEEKDLIITNKNTDKLLALNKIFPSKNINLITISYDEADYNILLNSKEKYILKNANSSLKRLLKKENNYIIEENIEKVLINLE